MSRPAALRPGSALVLLALASAASSAADPVPMGEVARYTFEKSKVFPGTTGEYCAYSYQVRPDGSLADKQKYFRLHTPDTADDAGADGIRVDRDGRVYVATRMGIQVCDQAGRVNCIIQTPNRVVSNLCFGGEQFDTLYATSGDRVYKRKLKVRGRTPSSRRPSRRRRGCRVGPPGQVAAG